MNKKIFKKIYKIIPFQEGKKLGQIAILNLLKKK